MRWILSLAFTLAIAGGLFYLILTRMADENGQPSQQNSSYPPPPFSASISHELRTPLNAIIGFTGIILQGMSGEINARQRDQLERVLASAKKLLGMIVDLVCITKIDTGTLTLHPSAFLVEEAVSEAIYEFRGISYLDINDISLQHNVPHNLQMYADRKKVSHCILNILICIVEWVASREIAIDARENRGNIDIIITTTTAAAERQTVQQLVKALERGEALPEERSGCNIRLQLVRKVVSQLLGGAMSATLKEDCCLELQLGLLSSLPEGNSRPGNQMDLGNQ